MLASSLTTKMRTPGRTPGRTPVTNRSDRRKFNFEDMHKEFLKTADYVFATEKSYTFFLDFDLPDQMEIPKILLNLAADYTVQNAILLAVEKFNSDLSKYCIRFEANSKYYGLRLAKKNGKPKLDMPCFDPTQYISNIKVEILSIHIIDRNAIQPINNQTNGIFTDTSPKVQQVNLNIQPIKLDCHIIHENPEISIQEQQLSIEQEDGGKKIEVNFCIETKKLEMWTEPQNMTLQNKKSICCFISIC